MKKILLVCSALLALTASNAAAQIQVAWNDCLADGGAAAKTSACTSNTGPFNKLIVSYTPTGSIPDFVAIDGVIDIQFDNGTPPQWWEFKNAGACRMTAAGISLDSSTLPNQGASCADTWDYGNSATGLFTGYAVSYGQPDKNRAVFAIARGASNPIAISAGTTYFGWVWSISNALTTSCSGCSEPAAVFSPVMTLSGVSSVAPIVLNASPNDGASCVSWNGGSCEATPTQATTWGKVKAMYR